MRARAFGFLAAAALFAAACNENPVLVDDDDEALEFEVSGLDALETLTPATIGVAAHQHGGARFMGFERLHLQYRLHDHSEWNEMDLQPHGDRFEGHHVFTTSGEYEMQVTGRRHGRGMMETFHQVPGHVEVARAHVEVGHHRVEFESFPGHMEAGEEAHMRFWVFENGEPVVGLEAEIVCTNEAGMHESHRASEIGPGVYDTEHVSSMPGELRVQLRFRDEHGEERHAEFHAKVESGHGGG